MEVVVNDLEAAKTAISKAEKLRWQIALIGCPGCTTPTTEESSAIVDALKEAAMKLIHLLEAEEYAEEARTLLIKIGALSTLLARTIMAHAIIID